MDIVLSEFSFQNIFFEENIDLKNLRFMNKKKLNKISTFKLNIVNSRHDKSIWKKKSSQIQSFVRFSKRLKNLRLKLDFFIISRTFCELIAWDISHLKKN